MIYTILISTVTTVVICTLFLFFIIRKHIVPMKKESQPLPSNEKSIESDNITVENTIGFVLKKSPDGKTQGFGTMEHQPMPTEKAIIGGLAGSPIAVGCPAGPSIIGDVVSGDKGVVDGLKIGVDYTSFDFMHNNTYYKCNSAEQRDEFISTHTGTFVIFNTTGMFKTKTNP